MALEQIKQVKGRGVHVPGEDIDTDRIIPARFMKCITFDGLGEYLFHDVRKNEDGSEKPHPLNAPQFSEATILLSGSNFGCGSSREHAPQALYRHGFRAVIAESYAEIFFGNSTTLGMPCISLAKAEIQEISKAIQADPSLELTIDVENKTVTAGSQVYQATLRESARHALIGGHWDPIAELLEGRNEITAVADRLSYV